MLPHGTDERRTPAFMRVLTPALLHSEGTDGFLSSTHIADNTGIRELVSQVLATLAQVSDIDICFHPMRKLPATVAPSTLVSTS